MSLSHQEGKKHTMKPQAPANIPTNSIIRRISIDPFRPLGDAANRVSTVGLAPLFCGLRALLALGCVFGCR